MQLSKILNSLFFTTFFVLPTLTHAMEKPIIDAGQTSLPHQTIIIPTNDIFDCGPKPMWLHFYKDTVYILNYMDDEELDKPCFVTAHSLDENKTLATIEIGAQPGQMILAAKSNSPRLYTINQYSLTVSVIDLLQNKLMGNYPFSTGKPLLYPSGALDDKERYLYVTCPNENKVAIMDTTTFKNTRHITVGSQPQDIIYAANKVYVCNQDCENSSISVIYADPEDSINTSLIATYGRIASGFITSSPFLLTELPESTKADISQTEKGLFVGGQPFSGGYTHVFETSEYAIPLGRFETINPPLPSHEIITLTNGQKYYIQLGFPNVWVQICDYLTNKVVQQIGPTEKGDRFGQPYVRQDLKKVFIPWFDRNHIQIYTFV